MDRCRPGSPSAGRLRAASAPVFADFVQVAVNSDLGNLHPLRHLVQGALDGENFPVVHKADQGDLLVPAHGLHVLIADGPVDDVVHDLADAGHHVHLLRGGNDGVRHTEQRADIPHKLDDAGEVNVDAEGADHLAV